MSFFDKRETPNPEVPPDPKPPEKTPADLIAESLRPFGDALTGITDVLKTVNSRLEAVETATKKPAAPPREAHQPTSVLENEDAAFAERMGPLAMRQFELESEIVRDRIETEYQRKGFGDMWEQYRTDIENTLRNTPLVQPDGQGGFKPLRGDPGYVRNTVNMIIGAAAVKQGVRFDGSKKQFFLESAGGTGGTTTPEAVDGLTLEQRRMFDRMKVSTEDRKKAVAGLKFIN